MDMLEKSIYALKKLHNSLCIVERLPEELLATIFKWRLAMERDSRDCEWLRVSQVCTKWRSVALDCPALWCFYRTTNLTWLEVLLRRSRTLPLYVGQNLHEENSGWFPQASLYIKRTRDLTFVVHCNTQWRRIFEALVKLQPEVPPLLDSLNVRWTGYDHVPTLPDNLFTSPPPRLRTLTLFGCMIDNNASLLLNLTSLALEQVYYHGETLPLSLAQLIGILRQAPKLEKLKLYRACKVEDGVEDIESHSAIETVHLSCLRHIDLDGPRCNAILSQITHPTPLPHIVLQLSSLPSRELVRYMPKLCSTLVNRIRPIHHLQVRVADRIELQYKCWGQENLSVDPAPLMTPDLELTLRAHELNQVDHSFTQSLQTISLASLQVLDIAVSSTPTTVGIWLAFEDLENLTTVRVKDLAVPTFLQALKKTYSVKADASSKSRYHTRPSFKSLRILILQKWFFNSSSMDEFLTCLAARRRCGAVLQQLEITDSTFSGSDDTDIVEQLREIVKDVIWDVKI
ncbi:hypothetical protein C0993_005525 [Termitomyces sp. T159_Od127]|nr:hypothetical protein C0993_005525 [Termitomyces sp. T159_Od127]